MKLWERWTRAGRELLRRRPAEAAPPPESPSGAPADPAAPAEPAGQGKLAGWLEERAHRAVSQAYETHAADLEQRAQRVIGSLYEKSADDLEERAVRAMRRAIEAEAERIEQAIEHGIAVKKREVRLSLLVLVVSALVYLALYWLTRTPNGP